MEAPVEGFVEEGGRVAGVRLDGRPRAARGKLVIAADGRSSLVRGRPAAGRGPRRADGRVLVPPAASRASRARRCAASSRPGAMVVLIDRRDYWQCAFLIPKGTGERSCAPRHRLDPRARSQQAVPGSRSRSSVLIDIDRPALARGRARPADAAGTGPGLLAIGDAAHAMSPIGGIGINLAIQDAVAAANILAGPLARGRGRRSACCTRCRTAGCCRRASSRPGRKRRRTRIIGRVLGGAPITRAAWPVRLLDRYPAAAPDSRAG